MKNLKMLSLAVAMLAITAGCAKEKAQDAASPAASPTIDSRGIVPVPPTTPTGSGTATVTLDIVGGDEYAKRTRLNEYFFTTPVNTLTPVSFSMHVAKDGPGYKGDVSIQFNDNGQTRTAFMSTTHPFFADVSDGSTNVWFNYNGNNVWHGFFQDNYGAIIVVVDSVVSLGDGSANGLVGGSVWFQNFGYTLPPQGPLKMCWQIQIGPYDCRSFLGDTGINGTPNPTMALYPNNSGNDRPAYKKLGDFSGLSRKAAFSE